MLGLLRTHRLPRAGGHQLSHRGRRMRAAGLICLGTGAGLIRGDLRDARGQHANLATLCQDQP